MQEIWRTVKDYPLYSVSNLGRLKNNKTQKILKGGLDSYGYRIVILCNNGKRKIKTIHRLIAESFIDNPDNKPQVNHINGVKTDNRVINLEWVTNQENQNHFWRVINSDVNKANRSKAHKGKNLLSENPNAKQVIRLEDGKIYPTIKEAALDIGVRYNKICDVCAGRAKTVKKYHFKYYKEFICKTA